MAFEINDLNIVSDKFGGQSKVWSYVSGDAYLTDNYFDDAIDVLAVGDLILVGDTTNSTVDTALVTSVTSHVDITVTPSS